MSLVVLVILAVVWAVFLLPQLFRARAERSTDSIGTFRRQLSVLERTSPVTPSTVTRMRPPARGQHSIHTSARPVPRRSPSGGPVSGRRPTTAAAPPARRATGKAAARKRRHDIFCGLLAAMVGSLLLGLLPPFRAMLVLHLILDVLFVAYVGMLVRARNLAIERDLKVRFLPSMGTVEPPLLLRRSAN